MKFDISFLQLKIVSLIQFWSHKKCSK